MTGWTPAVSQAEIIGVGLVQGAGFGFLFVPLTRHVSAMDVGAVKAPTIQRS